MTAVAAAFRDYSLRRIAPGWPLLALVFAALLPSGCASSDEAATDYDNTYQSTPAKPEDSHGWGEGVSAMGK